MMKLVPMRIGTKYQAELPALRPRPDQHGNGSRVIGTPPTRYMQHWTPSRFTTEEVTDFLRRFCRLNEAELGLQCLMKSDFDIDTAVQLLHDARRAKAEAQRAETERVSDEAFGSAVATHGKKFFVIKQGLTHVTTGDVIRRFYLWKTSSAYRIWRERVKARRSKESSRLRSWAGSEDSDASDFHNEYCELCFTGGQLLCCDGCERAYHFSCVTPPISEIPTGDWFCAHCSTILDTSLRTQPSTENPHCREVVLLGDSGAEASDVETLDIEDIDDDDDDDCGGDIAARSDPNRFDSDDATRDAPATRERTAACGTDESESDSGVAATPSPDARGTSQPQLKLEPRRSERRDSAKIKTETRVAPPASLLLSQLQAPRTQASPAKVALALEPSANERKRKRKTEAPRRILQ